MSDGSLLIEIKGSAKEFVAALENVKGKAADLQNQLKFTAEVGAAAFAAFGAEVGLATRAYAKQEEATNSLSQALQQQGMYSDALVESYRAQAEAIQEKTGVDAEEIVQGQALIQGYVGQHQITKQLTQAVVDFAAAQHIDLKSAFDLVGKSASSTTNILSRYGIHLDSNASTSEKLTQIGNELSGMFGGQAEAANKGLGGIKGLSVAFEDMQKRIGERLAPVIESLIHGLTGLFNRIADNKVLLDLIASLTAAGAVAGGLLTIVAGGAFAFLKFKEALEAAKIATSAMTLATEGLMGATGIGIIVVVLSEVLLNWSSIWPRMQAIYRSFVENVSALAGGLGKLLLGAVTMNLSEVKEGWAQVKAATEKGIADYSAELQKGQKAQEDQTQKHEMKQSAIQKQFADQRQKEKNTEENYRLAATKANDQAMEMEIDRSSKASIALKKEEAQILSKLSDDKNKSIRGQLREALAQTRQMEADQQQLDVAQQNEFQNRLLASSKSYEAMSLKDRAAFLKKNQQDLQASILTEKTAREKAAKDELALQIKTQNQFLLDQQKFGVAYATINQAMHSAIYEGSKEAFGNLQELTSSSNDTLKAIGKAASIANIVIKTAESAMNIYAGFSTIPIIGPALGIAGAAAAVAFGAEQVGQVTSAATGGIIEGGIPGRDSVPAMLMPGELVVPTKNYDEVISAVASHRAASDRAAQSAQAAAPAQPMTAQIELSLKDQLIEFIETKIVERQRLGISLLVTA